MIFATLVTLDPDTGCVVEQPIPMDRVFVIPHDFDRYTRYCQRCGVAESAVVNGARSDCDGPPKRTE